MADASPLCGEHADESAAGRVIEVVLGQLQRILNETDESLLARVALAYEPVWEVRTGRKSAASSGRAGSRFDQERS
jgi:triosephosphate isomerase